MQTRLRAMEHEPMNAVQQIGRYRLCFELGSGGMATVYLARADGPAGFEKLVALKRIHVHLASEKRFVDMFLDEARITSRLSHPNVCSVFDFGVASGTYYMAMEYVVGETVARLIAALARSEAKYLAVLPAYAARIVADACEGLHAAHELRGDRGEPLDLVHRDVSPANLFVTYDGAVKVVDFGVARAAGALHQTVSGTVKGKWSYMAPEQAKQLSVDRRADIWSLGVVLWEILTGKRLFRRDTEPETIVAVLQDSVPAPSRLRPVVPAKLDAIVLRALSRDRRGRYSTARQLADDLNRFLRSQRTAAGMAELGAWMHEIFRDEYARRQELIEQARKAEAGVVPKVSAILADGEQSPLGPVAASVAEVSASTVIERPRRARRFLLVAAAGMTSLIMAYVLSVIDPRLGARVVPRSPAIATQPVPNATEVRGDDAPVTPLPPRLGPPGDAAGQISAPPPEGPRTNDRRRARKSASAEVPSQHEAPVSVGEPGTVDVATPGGWAIVVVGGQPRGQSPLRLSLPPGRQVLELRPFGGLPSRLVPVTVPAGGSTRVVVPVSTQAP